jgi:hypothetical protein
LELTKLRIELLRHYAATALLAIDQITDLQLRIGTEEATAGMITGLIANGYRTRKQILTRAQELLGSELLPEIEECLDKWDRPSISGGLWRRYPNGTYRLH